MTRDTNNRGRTNIGVEPLTEENWPSSSRVRSAAGIWMHVRIEPAPGGRYRTIWGGPPKFGSDIVHDTLDQALAYANRRPGKAMTATLSLAGDGSGPWDDPDAPEFVQPRGPGR
jgi:hypothetical protein